MSHDIVVEVNIILEALLIGAAGCFLYDLLRIFRRILPRGELLTGIEDIIWWMVLAVAAFSFMYHANGGIVRAYIVIFMLMGMLIWEWAAGRFIVKYVSWLLKVIWDKFLGKIIKFIGKTFFYNFLNKIFKILHKLLKKVIKPFKIHVTEQVGKRGADIEKTEEQERK